MHPPLLSLTERTLQLGHCLLSGTMVQLTLISRVHDALMLAEDLDNEKDKELVNYKDQAKVTLLSSLSTP